MSLYAHILVPVDGSPTADRGLREAIRLASALGSKLRLLHVIDDFPMLVELSTISSFEAGMQQMRQYGESVLTKALSEATAADVQAQTVLREIGADTVAQLLVFNKLDALESAQHPLHLQDEMEIDGVQVPRIFLSAKSGEGVPLLRAELARQSGSVADTMSPEADAELHDAAD